LIGVNGVLNKHDDDDDDNGGGGVLVMKKIILAQTSRSAAWELIPFNGTLSRRGLRPIKV